MTGYRSPVPGARAARAWIQALTALLFTLLVPNICAANPSPLREYLGIKRAVFEQPRSDGAVALQAQVAAESRVGARRLRIRDFLLISDSGGDDAGYTLGPDSWAALVGVLAGGVADEFVIQAAVRKIPLDSIDVVVTGHSDDPSVESKRKVIYPRNLSYVAYIDSPATDAQLESLRASVERMSPVLNLVVGSQTLAPGEVFHTASPAKRDPALPRGLRDFLAEERAAIQRQEKSQRVFSYALRAQAHVEPNTGLIDVRTADGFQFLIDSSADFGGYGLAPTVEEHMLGVLGTCLTHVYEWQAAIREVVLDSLELRFNAELTSRSAAASPPRIRNIRYSVHVNSPAAVEQIHQLRDAVDATCPIYNLLKDPQTVNGRIERVRR